MDLTLLKITPHGTVICDSPNAKGLAAFAESDASGLVALAGRKLDMESDASIGFWKHFGNLFLRALCHVPEGAALDLPPPTQAELAELILNAPPMRGAEYLSPEVLSNLWKRLEERTGIPAAQINVKQEIR